MDCVCFCSSRRRHTRFKCDWSSDVCSSDLFFNLELIAESLRGIAMAVLTLSEKLDQLGTRYDELTQQLSTQEIVSDSSRFQNVAKQHAELQQIFAKHRAYNQTTKDLATSHHMYLDTDEASINQR